MSKYEIEFLFTEAEEKRGVIVMNARNRKEAVDSLVFKVDSHLKLDPTVDVIENPRSESIPRPKFIAVCKVKEIA